MHASEAERSEDHDRVDREPLEALHQSVPRATVEGHPLLDLGGRGSSLQHEYVGLGMARALDRHDVAARAVLAGGQLPAKIIQLPDRALEVLLADLVVGDG